MAPSFASALTDALPSLKGIVTSLERYSSSFTGEAAHLFKNFAGDVAQLDTFLQTKPVMQGRIATYVTSGVRNRTLASLQAGIMQKLTTMLSGGIPLPRSSKDSLGDLRTLMMMCKMQPEDEQQASTAQSLQTLYEDAVNNRREVEAVEVVVDDIMRKLIKQQFEVDKLHADVLELELNGLNDGVVRSGTASGAMAGLGVVLSLALNSLQRVHAAQLSVEHDETDEDSSTQAALANGVGADEDDDDDDMFFMPLPNAPLKLADEKKFTTLAQPLGNTDASPGDTPMLQMDEESESGSRKPSDNGKAASSSQQAMNSMSSPQPSDLKRSNSVSQLGPAGPFTPVIQGTTISAAAPLSDPVSRAGVPGADRPNPKTPTVSEPAAAAAPPAAVPAPGDEKHSQFVNFLQGQNPGACMFHAQMRLSVEGCRKLSNFLAGSNRVRALSLSHNFLGDGGLAILCEGLCQNSSIHTVDLPHNNISDQSVQLLAIALRNNHSLTQLQLASNTISDAGAVALAELLKANPNIKKLGLAHNNIGKVGCQALTAAISQAKSLQQLQLLPGNPVEEKDAKALAKALNGNKKFSIRSLLGIN